MRVLPLRHVGCRGLDHTLCLGVGPKAAGRPATRPPGRRQHASVDRLCVAIGNRGGRPRRDIYCRHRRAARLDATGFVIHRRSTGFAIAAALPLLGVHANVAGDRRDVNALPRTRPRPAGVQRAELSRKGPRSWRSQLPSHSRERDRSPASYPRGPMRRLAILDDYQQVAGSLADWSRLEAAVEVQIFHDHLAGLDALAERLRDFEIIVAMRERTPFPAATVRTPAEAGAARPRPARRPARSS